MRAVQYWVGIIRPCILLLPLFCALAQTLPQHLQPRLHKRSNAPQQQQPNVQQQFPAFHQGGGGPFPAQAFASKLSGPPLVEGGPPPPRAASNAIHPNAGQQQAQPPPQFVANNGPLIRSPDGQFVLAPQPSQQQQQPQFGGAFFQQGSSPPLGFQPQFGQASSAQFAPPPSSSQPQGSQFAPPTNNNNNNNNNGGAFPPFSSQPNAPPPTVPNNSASSPLPNGGPAEFTNSSDSSTPATGPTSPLPPVDKSVDLDGDGALSLNEVQYAAFVHHGLSSSVVENLFNEVDHNKDAFLSALEFNDIRPLVLAKAENAALRYLQNVDTDHNGLLSLQEAQAYILREYGISNRDVERIWRLVVPSSSDEMDAVLFSKLRRRVRGMSIRLARQIMKGSDRDQDGHIDLREAQLIAFEQEGIGPAEVIEMLASVDDNNDGQLNAPEFADFERIVRAKSVETSKKALKVVDTDGSGSLTMEEAKKIAFDHYGFDEATLEPFFAQADENEDGQLDSVEFAGFRSVIRGRAVKNALMLLPEMDDDGDGLISEAEAEQRTRREDDMTPSETHGLFSVADQDRNGLLDKVELADFVRLVRLTSIKFVADHFRDYDSNRDKLVTLDELEKLVKDRYKLDPGVTRRFFDKVDVDRSGDLNPGEIVDFRHEVRRLAQDRVMQAELEEQNRREMAEIEQRLRHEAEARKPQPESAQKTRQESSSAEDNSARSSTEGPRKAPIETTSPAGKESVEEVEEQQQRHREEENSGRVVEDAEEKEKEPRSGTGGDKRPTTRGESAVDEEHPGPTTTSSSAAAASSAASSSAIHGSTTATNENDPEPQPSPNKSIASISDGGENNSPAISPMASATNSLPTTAANGTEGVKVMATSDSIGTTTKKQRKRRRKTTTPASTSTTTTSTTTTTTTTTTTPTSTTTTTAQPAAEESYEESAEEEPATGGEN